MIRRLVALVAVALLLGGAAAEEEARVYAAGEWYHATPMCAGTGLDAREYVRLWRQARGEGEMAEAAQRLLEAYWPLRPVSEAKLWGYPPCPICIGDGTDYGEPRATARGGTLVARLPDAWLDALPRFEVFGTAGDETLRDGDAAFTLSELLRGEAYVDFLNALRDGGTAQGEAARPEFDDSDGGLGMHARHIGGAWYLTFRPDADARRAMKAGDAVELTLRLEGGGLRGTDDALALVNWGLRYEDALTLTPEPPERDAAFKTEADRLALSLFDEMDAHILVIRERDADPERVSGASLALGARLALRGLNGYMDGADAVYVGVLSDSEARRLEEGDAPLLLHDGESLWETLMPIDKEEEATESPDGQPGPGRDLSFLSDYADAIRVGDWYLACKAATAEGPYRVATRNEDAEWVLLDGEGRLLQDDLRWWPKGVAWPLQPRPFEGFEEGTDVAVLRVGQLYGLIDRRGEQVTDFIYTNLFNVLPGYEAIPAELDGKWGAINAKGRVVVPFIYDNSFARFEGGCTVAERDGKYCLLGADGTELMSPEYDDMSIGDGDTYGMAHRGDTCVVFDRQGQILFEKALSANSWIYTMDDAEPPFACYDGRTEKYRYIGADGAFLPGGPYEEAVSFFAGDETARAVEDGKTVLVRRDGSIALRTDCEEVGALSCGLARASRGGLWGYVDGAYDDAIPFDYAWADTFINGYACARPRGDDAGCGLIDTAGNWVIPPEAGVENVAVGDDGVAVVSKGGARLYYRLDGGAATPVGALEDVAHRDVHGYLPNEDDVKLAKLDGMATLAKRASEQDRLPHLDGTARLYPLYAAAVAAVYPKDTTCSLGWNDYRNDGNPILTFNEAGTAWDRLSEGDADVIFVPAPQPEDGVWATLAARGQVPEFTPLCREALVFPVNADNPLTDISSAQLAAVYAGELTDWSDLGAEGLGEIVAYQPQSEEVSALFERTFAPAAPAPEGVSQYDSWLEEAVTGPVDFRALPDALGCALRYDCRELLETGEIRLLSVDGVAPTDENLASGAYPYTQTLYAVRLKGNDNPNVLALIDWLKTEQLTELAVKTGYAG